MEINKATGLDAAGVERLALLIEECNELAQVACKILRHGYESYNPNDETKTTNRTLFEKELEDLGFAIALLCLNNDIDLNNVSQLKPETIKRKRKYLHFNEAPSRSDEKETVIF